MENTRLFFLFTVLLSGLTGCVENTDYEDEWYEVRDDLINKKWESSLIIEEEYNWHEVWVFDNSGHGVCDVIKTSKNGKEEIESTRYFLWILTLDLVVNIDDSRYWEIEELTSEKLCVYETWDDPIKVPGQMYREYREFAATQ